MIKEQANGRKVASGLGALRRTPPASDVATPHPARGVAKVHIGLRSRVRIPDGPPVQPPLDVDDLTKVLNRLRELT